MKSINDLIWNLENDKTNGNTVKSGKENETDSIIKICACCGGPGGMGGCFGITGIKYQ